MKCRGIHEVMPVTKQLFTFRPYIGGNSTRPRVLFRNGEKSMKAFAATFSSVVQDKHQHIMFEK